MALKASRSVDNLKRMFKINKIIHFSELLSKEAIYFSIRAAMMLVLWIFLDQLLILDFGIMQSIQHQGIFILNKLSHFNYHSTSVLLAENSAAFSIICENTRLNVGKSCDGKSLMFMYLSFIFIYPNIHIKRRLIYAFGGLILIHEFNMIRVVLLSITLKHHPNHFPIMHKYFFQIFMYALIFILVKLFLKTQPDNAIQ